MDVTIRPALPRGDEGEQFAHYFDIASDGLLRWMFGKRFVDVVGRAFLEPGHDMSFQHVWFAETDGIVAGMVSGFSAADHERSKDGLLLRAAGVRSIRLLATWLLAARVFRFMDRVPAGDWYLQAVAIDQARRGAGIGSRLLDHAEATAAKEGARRLALDVAVDNEDAKRLYERRGMALDSTSASVPFKGTAVHRMIKVL